jgi:transposase-like protein
MTMKCAGCGKDFTFAPSSTPSSVIQCFAAGSLDKIEFRPTCPHCGKGNKVVVAKGS